MIVKTSKMVRLQLYFLLCHLAAARHQVFTNYVRVRLSDSNQTAPGRETLSLNIDGTTHFTFPHH